MPDDASTRRPSRARRLRSTAILGSLVIGVGVYEVGWGDDPVWGWAAALIAAGIIVVQLVWLPAGQFVVKAALTLVVVAVVVVMITDPFLAIARARVFTHRSEMTAVGTRTLGSPVAGTFAGSRTPAGPITRLAGTDDIAPVPDVPTIAGESVAFGAVVLEPTPLAMYCLDEACTLVLVYAPRNEPSPRTCPDGRTDRIDALLDDWYRMLPASC